MNNHQSPPHHPPMNHYAMDRFEQGPPPPIPTSSNLPPPMAPPPHVNIRTEGGYPSYMYPPNHRATSCPPSNPIPPHAHPHAHGGPIPSHHGHGPPPPGHPPLPPPTAGGYYPYMGPPPTQAGATPFNMPPHPPPHGTSMPPHVASSHHPPPPPYPYYQQPSPYVEVVPQVTRVRSSETVSHTNQARPKLEQKHSKTPVVSLAAEEEEITFDVTKMERSKSFPSQMKVGHHSPPTRPVQGQEFGSPGMFPPWSPPMDQMSPPHPGMYYGMMPPYGHPSPPGAFPMPPPHGSAPFVGHPMYPMPFSPGMHHPNGIPPPITAPQSCRAVPLSHQPSPPNPIMRAPTPPPYPMSHHPYMVPPPRLSPSPPSLCDGCEFCDAALLKKYHPNFETETNDKKPSVHAKANTDGTSHGTNDGTNGAINGAANAGTTGGTAHETGDINSKATCVEDKSKASEKKVMKGTPIPEVLCGLTLTVEAGDFTEDCTPVEAVPPPMDPSPAAAGNSDVNCNGNVVKIEKENDSKAETPASNGSVGCAGAIPSPAVVSVEGEINPQKSEELEICAAVSDGAVSDQKLPSPAHTERSQQLSPGGKSDEEEAKGVEITEEETALPPRRQALKKRGKTVRMVRISNPRESQVKQKGSKNGKHKEEKKEDEIFTINGEKGTRKYFLSLMKRKGCDVFDCRLLHTMRCSLEDLLNAQIVNELARHKYGSRYLQKCIESEPVPIDSLRRLCDVLLVDGKRLCQDTVGNFVIQKLLEVTCERSDKNVRLFELGHLILERVFVGNVRILSEQEYSCRVIQRILRYESYIDIKLKILSEIESERTLDDYIRHPFGNHVVQKCIEKIPNEYLNVISRNISRETYSYSIHIYGCRVIQRLLSHCNERQTRPMYDIIIKNIVKLSKNQFGNYVVQHVLNICRNHSMITQICKVISNHMLNLSCHKFASNVVERCLRLSNGKNKQELIHAVLSNSNKYLVPKMVQDQYGNYVLQTLFDSCHPNTQLKLVNLIQRNVPRSNLLKLSWGKHIMNKMEMLSKERNSHSHNSHMMNSHNNGHGHGHGHGKHERSRSYRGNRRW